MELRKIVYVRDGKKAYSNKWYASFFFYGKNRRVALSEDRACASVAAQQIARLADWIGLAGCSIDNPKLPEDLRQWLAGIERRLYEPLEAIFTSTPTRTSVFVEQMVFPTKR